jgi:chlorobactene glucosyltransferase
MDPASLILILSSVALVAGVGFTYWIHHQGPTDIVVFPKPLAPQTPAPLISIIIPARNEQRNIRDCVESLLAQDYPSFEVIVVEDRSTDATPQILAEILTDVGGRETGQPGKSDSVKRLRVLSGKELPPGWVGKPHALAQGAAAAGGEWLCFVDADTFAHPALLASTYQVALANGADLFTILTNQELKSFWEKTILPLVFTALWIGFPARKVNDPDNPLAIANGQFILIRRSVYQAIGGHEAVRHSVVEDKAIAEAIKRAGYRLILADGRAVARTRMYTSFAEIWEGWTKNMFLGTRDRLGLFLLGGILALFGALALPVWLVGGLIWWLLSGGLIPAVVALQSLALWVYLLFERARIARVVNISPLYSLTSPLGAMIFIAMAATSTYRILTGQGVSWKGRTYLDSGDSEPID